MGVAQLWVKKADFLLAARCMAHHELMWVAREKDVRHSHFRYASPEGPTCRVRLRGVREQSTRVLAW